MAGAAHGHLGLDVRRRRDGAIFRRKRVGPRARPSGKTKFQKPKSASGFRGILTAAFLKLRCLRRLAVRLAGRSDRPGAGHVVKHPRIFILHRRVLLRRSTLAAWRIAISGGTGDGGRMVVGRRAGHRMLAGSISSAVGGRDRGGGKFGIPTDWRAAENIFRYIGSLALDDVGLHAPREALLGALVILAFLPESRRWRQAVELSKAHPLREIFTTRLIRPTLLAIGLASVALIGTWGCVLLKRFFLRGPIRMG